MPTASSQCLTPVILRRSGSGPCLVRCDAFSCLTEGFDFFCSVFTIWHPNSSHTPKQIGVFCFHRLSAIHRPSFLFSFAGFKPACSRSWLIFKVESESCLDAYLPDILLPSNVPLRLYSNEMLSLPLGGQLGSNAIQLPCRRAFHAP